MSGNRYSSWPHVSNPCTQITTDTLAPTHRRVANSNYPLDWFLIAASPLPGYEDICRANREKRYAAPPASDSISASRLRPRCADQSCPHISKHRVPRTVPEQRSVNSSPACHHPLLNQRGSVSVCQWAGGPHTGRRVTHTLGAPFMPSHLGHEWEPIQLVAPRL
jgi:hypothetical protein